MQRIFFLLSATASLLLSHAAHATVTIAGVEQASGFNPTGTAVIYGGIAGPTCPGGVTTVCNNCVPASKAACLNGAGTDQTPLCSCNTARISDSTILKINLTNSATPGGNAIATMGTTIVGSSGAAQTITPNTIANGGTFFDTRWQNICNGIAAGSCEVQTNGATGTLTICIDKNNNSICDNGEDQIAVSIKIVQPGTGGASGTTASDYNIFGIPIQDGVGGFTPYPGDGKVFIENMNSAASFPNLTYSSQITAARVFISDVSMDNANVNGPVSSQDLSVSTDGTGFDQSSVTGLDNGKLYFFRLAMVDQANNVVQFFPGNLGPGDFGGSCTGATASKACPYAVKPDQVLGLLTKDVNCFIATAAYGTSLEPKLTTFRDFRYKVLLPHEWGKSFVLSYYRYGPYAARYIADRPVLRTVARGLLWPLYGFSWLALRYGLATAGALGLLALGMLVTLPWIGVRRMRLRV